jgi:hypothetical protein
MGESGRSVNTAGVESASANPSLSAHAERGPNLLASKIPVEESGY